MPQQTGERIMHDDRIENGGNCSGSRSNISNETVKDICHVLEKTLIECVSQKIKLSRIIKLFLMAEKNLHNEDKASYMVKQCLQDPNNVKTTDVHWDTTSPLHNEDNLWNISAMRGVQGRLSSMVDDNELSNRFSDLEKSEDPSLGLMLWLFPTLATEERLKKVYGIVCKDNRSWTLQDKMLFWLACVQNQNTNRWIVTHVEAQIRCLQLESGAFANVEGKDEDGDVISSAMDLLVLVYCARQNDTAFAAAQKTVSWIVAHLKGVKGVEALSRAWALYALSEFIKLNG